MSSHRVEQSPSVYARWPGNPKWKAGARFAHAQREVAGVWRLEFHATAVFWMQGDGNRRYGWPPNASSDDSAAATWQGLRADGLGRGARPRLPSNRSPGRHRDAHGRARDDADQDRRLPRLKRLQAGSARLFD